MHRCVPKILSFLFAMTLLTVVCTVLWSMLITDKLYHCIDPLFPGYLSPGSWVHGNIVYVEEIDIHNVTQNRDSIKNGWSEGAL